MLHVHGSDGTNEQTLYPQFLKNPDNLNQKSFPLELFHCNFTPDIWNSRFLKPIFVCLRGLRNRDSTVYTHLHVCMIAERLLFLSSLWNIATYCEFILI